MNRPRWNVQHEPTVVECKTEKDNIRDVRAEPEVKRNNNMTENKNS